MSGAAAWVAITSTAPYTLGIHPLPVAAVVAGALVTAGAALLPDVDHPSATIARSGGFVTHVVAAAASTAAGGHRKGMHSILAVAGFTVGAILAGRWHAQVPVLGVIPAGSALLLLALVAFASKALRLGPGGIAKLWVGAATIVVAILAVFPEQLDWVPLSVMLGVIVHLLGDMLTTGGVPLLWPWIPKPPRTLTGVPVLSSMWKPNGYMAIPVLGRTGSAREWLLFVALSGYTLYTLVLTVGVVVVPA
jgi:membrane-bound metal-dependent hydrolase YbcI (DUF457 family)